ncbi:sodium:proton exchanger [archaeon]|jgi:Kef-type K+ transport system membrane component KefB/Trk K+ transport system NAD-binding subunit|nr:sodium:proton exchanger [archaeon]
MEEIFIQLALILFTAFVVSFIARSFKQPIIIGYILAGVIISPFILSTGASTEVINLFSEFGIALLLFIVGLHMNPKVIREVGLSAFLIGVSQIVLTFGLGFLVSWQILRFELIASAYVGIAMAFSSTIIIMKLLSDKRHLDSLYGKISVGILILQDLVAICALMFITSISKETNLQEFMFNTFISGGGLIVGLFLFAYLILPRMIKNIAKSQELLFLFSICWCFVIAALFSYLGFSIEIGALLAGISLSISPYSTEISSKIKPLRDFFLILFFIILGLDINLSNLGSILGNAIILSLVALILKPLIIMTFMALFGYTKRTNFLVGTTLAQISEFSLIILGLGVTVGHITSELMSTITLTALITITLSTYMITYSKEFYNQLPWLFSLFEKKKVRFSPNKTKEVNTILFGYNRMGFSILNSLKRMKKKYLIVDFNPDIIDDLQKLGMPSLYGDVYDKEFLEDLPLNKIKMAISTVPDFETNVLLLETIRRVNPRARVITRADSIEEAFTLYKKGATYVLTPHFLGGQYVAKIITGTREEDYTKEKQKHLKMLEERHKKIQKHLDSESLN